MTLDRRRFLSVAAVTATAAAAGVLLAACSGSQTKTDAASVTKTDPATTKPTPTGTPTPTATATTVPVTLSPAVAAQVAYLEAHWNNYNTAEYNNLNSVGGDCANFASQGLIARGWTMNSQWYNHYATGGGWGSPWGYVPAMENYFAANATAFGLVRMDATQRANFAVGDLVMFSWEGKDNISQDLDHVQTITRIDGTGPTAKILMASHNDDYAYRDLDHEITVEHPGATYHVWHLTTDTDA